MTPFFGGWGGGAGVCNYTSHLLQLSGQIEKSYNATVAEAPIGCQEELCDVTLAAATKESSGVYEVTFVTSV